MSKLKLIVALICLGFSNLALCQSNFSMTDRESSYGTASFGIPVVMSLDFKTVSAKSWGFGARYSDYRFNSINQPDDYYEFAFLLLGDRADQTVSDKFRSYSVYGLYSINYNEDPRKKLHVYAGPSLLDYHETKFIGTDENPIATNYKQEIDRSIRVGLLLGTNITVPIKHWLGFDFGTSYLINPVNNRFTISIGISIGEIFNKKLLQK